MVVVHGGHRASASDDVPEIIRILDRWERDFQSMVRGARNSIDALNEFFVSREPALRMPRSGSLRTRVTRDREIARRFLRTVFSQGVQNSRASIEDLRELRRSLQRVGLHTELDHFMEALPENAALRGRQPAYREINEFRAAFDENLQGGKGPNRALIDAADELVGKGEKGRIIPRRYIGEVFEDLLSENLLSSKESDLGVLRDIFRRLKADGKTHLATRYFQQLAPTRDPRSIEKLYAFLTRNYTGTIDELDLQLVGRMLERDVKTIDDFLKHIDEIAARDPGEAKVLQNMIDDIVSRTGNDRTERIERWRAAMGRTLSASRTPEIRSAMKLADPSLCQNPNGLVGRLRNILRRNGSG